MKTMRHLTIFLFAVVLPAAAFAADKGRQLYDLRYADQRKQVDATSGKADDVALAAQHLKDVEKYASSPELVKVLLEQACELGMRDTAGYATAAGAAELLIAKFPADKAACVDKAIRVYDLQVRRSRDRAAGEKLIALLLTRAGAKAGEADFNAAMKLAARAYGVAYTVKSPRKAEIDALRKYYQSRRDLKIKPSSAVLRRKVIGMCVVELDDPAEGAELLTGDMPEQLRTYVPLAAKDPSEVAEAACLELGNWYVELAGGASAGGKAVCLDRAVVYLERFLDLHKAEDTSRTQGKLLLDKARAERQKIPAATRPRLTAKPGEWIDVLKLVDVEKHAVYGKWRRNEDGSITGSGRFSKGKGTPRILLPIIPNGDYMVQAEFTRLSGISHVALLLPVRQRGLAVGLNVAAKSSKTSNVDYHALASLDGGDWGESPAVFRPGNLKNGQRYRIVAVVRFEGDQVDISVELDETRILAWTGAVSSCSLRAAHAMPKPGYLGLVNASTRFHSVKLRVLSGEAKADSGLLQ